MTIVMTRHFKALLLLVTFYHLYRSKMLPLLLSIQYGLYYCVYSPYLQCILGSCAPKTVNYSTVNAINNHIPHRAQCTSPPRKERREKANYWCTSILTIWRWTIQRSKSDGWSPLFIFSSTLVSLSLSLSLASTHSNALDSTIGSSRSSIVHRFFQ